MFSCLVHPGAWWLPGVMSPLRPRRMGRSTLVQLGRPKSMARPGGPRQALRGGAEATWEPWRQRIKHGLTIDFFNQKGDEPHISSSSQD